MKMKRKLKSLFAALLVAVMIAGNLPTRVMASGVVSPVIEPVVEASTVEATAIPTTVPTEALTATPSVVPTAEPIATPEPTVEPTEAPVEVLAVALAETTETEREFLELVLGQQESVSVENAGDEVWYKFVPEESARYEFSGIGNSSFYIYLYDSTYTCIGNIGNIRNQGVSLYKDLEAGKTYYYRLSFKHDGYQTATVVLEKLSIISAEVKSYTGVTTEYYELMTSYDNIFNAYCLTLAIKTDDGAELEVRGYDDEWHRYSVDYELYTSNGENVSFDDNNKLPVGEYYAEITVLGEMQNLKIPYFVKSIADEATTLVLGQQESVSVENYYGEVWYKFVPEESGVYKFSLTTPNQLGVYVYNSSFEQMSSAYQSVWSEKLEANEIYYYRLWFTIEGYLTASFMLEKVPSIVSAEIKSYDASTTEYYEIFDEYSSLPAYYTTLTLHFDDGTEVDASVYDDVCKLYRIENEFYTSEGVKASYDSSRKLPVGDYYIEFTILGEKYDLKIPCSVKSLDDVEVVELVEGRQQSASVEKKYDKVWYKFTPKKTARYSFGVVKDISRDCCLDVYDSSFKQIAFDVLYSRSTGSSMSVSLEAGETYYYSLEFWDANYLNTIVVLEELIEVTSAGMKSYEGATTLYYEELEAYDNGILYRFLNLSLCLADGSELEIKPFDLNSKWGAYQIECNIYTSSGERAFFDENGKLPIGDYYAELTVLGEKYDLIIPYSVISSADIPTEGTCGENLTWAFDRNGELIISGTGAMNDYNNAESVPWKYYKDSITSVVLPEGLTHIGASAFYNCTSLQNVELPDGLESIGEYAFYNCTSLEGMELPENLTPVVYSLYASDSATSIVLPDSLTSIGEYAFYNCTSLTNIVLPDNVVALRAGVFGNCNQVEKIVFGEGVAEINTNGSEHALYGLTNVTEVTFTGTTVPTMTNADCGVFEYMTSLETVYVPMEAYDDCVNTFANQLPSTVEIVTIAPTPECVYGDANGDDEINTKDVILIRRHVAAKNPTTGESTVEAKTGADANGDGVVNTKDVILVRRYVAGKNPVTGESSVVLGPNK